MLIILSASYKKYKLELSYSWSQQLDLATKHPQEQQITMPDSFFFSSSGI